MCRTFQESVTTGIVVTFTACIFFATKKPEYIWFGAFLIAISLTQWIDAYIWYAGLENTQLLVKYGISSSLILELLVGYAGLVYALKTRLPVVYEICLLLYSVSVLYTWWFVTCEETTVSADGFLIWCGKKSSTIGRILFFMFLSAPFFWFPDPVLRPLIIGWMFITFVVSFGKDSFGANWCHSANLMSVFSLARLLV